MNTPQKIVTGTEAEVCNDIAERQALGYNKYGVTVENNPLSLREWLQHAYEECLDQSVYLKRAMEEMDKTQAKADEAKHKSEAMFGKMRTERTRQCLAAIGDFKTGPEPGSEEPEIVATVIGTEEISPKNLYRNFLQNFDTGGYIPSGSGLVEDLPIVPITRCGTGYAKHTSGRVEPFYKSLPLPDNWQWLDDSGNVRALNEALNAGKHGIASQKELPKQDSAL